MQHSALSNLLSQREAQDARIAALSEEREELARRIRELEGQGGPRGPANISDDGHVQVHHDDLAPSPRRNTVHGVGKERDPKASTKGKKSRSCNIL